jgi:hypothetical protein
MDYFTLLFWLGFIILIVSHVMLLGTSMNTHAIIALLGTGAMFVGSKIGRKFLGID